jgi:hypothetical protein
MSPIVVVSMATSIVGSVLGLWITDNLPSGKYYIDVALGVILFLIFAVFLLAKSLEFPPEKKADFISRKLGLGGTYYEPSLGKVVEYKTSNMPIGLPVFAVVGLLAGMFGMGAGWANVPVLNLISGVPIKVATSTSMLIITINDAAASWVYLSDGALLPMILTPCILGITIGARIGTKIATRTRPKSVRYLVMAVMLIAAVLDIHKGIDGLGIL